MKKLFTTALLLLAFTLTAQTWYYDTSTDLMTGEVSKLFFTNAIANQGTYRTPYMGILRTDDGEMVSVTFSGSFVARETRTMAVKFGDGVTIQVPIMYSDDVAFIRNSEPIIAQMLTEEFVTVLVRGLRGSMVAQFDLVGLKEVYEPQP